MKYTKDILEQMMKNDCGSLDLSGTKIKSLPDNLIVGGSLYFRNTKIESINTLKIHNLSNGEYMPDKYLYADNILIHVKRCRYVGKYTYYIGKIPNYNVIYDGENYAHCKNIKEGIRDLEFKAAKNRGSEQYKNLTIDSIVRIDDAITMYRVRTGACQQGTEKFINGLKELKDKYSIREIIELTKGQYNSHVFKEFFMNN